MKPYVGAIVHYVSHGTPLRQDGSQAFTGKCRAAIIADLDPVVLCVLNPTGLFFHEAERDDYERAGGTWHWPEPPEREPGDRPPRF